MVYKQPKVKMTRKENYWFRRLNIELENSLSKNQKSPCLHLGISGEKRFDACPPKTE